MDVAIKIQSILDQLNPVLVGKNSQVQDSVACLLAGGHLLIEDVPGVGKTTLAHALARTFGLQFSRVQFTADLMPSDLSGVAVYERGKEAFVFHPGPVFTQVLLADEINRASPKTQSALLEVMEERQVTVDGTTHPVGSPFMVIATQNPVEQAGTYRLPEAQLDRFMIKTSIGYPDDMAMRRILQQQAAPAKLQPVMNTGTLVQLQGFVNEVYVSPLIVEYITRLVEASRNASEVRLGASVRGAIALQRMASAWSLIHGRAFVTPDDVRGLATSVLAHRLVLEPEAEFDGVTAEQIVGQLLLDIPEPQENGTA